MEIRIKEKQLNNMFNYYLVIGNYGDDKECLIYETNNKLEGEEFKKFKNNIEKAFNFYNMILANDTFKFINTFKFNLKKESEFEFKFNIGDKISFNSYNDYVNIGFIKNRYLKDNQKYYSIEKDTSIEENIPETKIVFYKKGVIDYDDIIIHNNEIYITRSGKKIENNKLFYEVTLINNLNRNNIYLTEEQFEVLDIINYKNRNDKYAQYSKNKEYCIIKIYLQKVKKYIIELKGLNTKCIDEEELILINIESNNSREFEINDFVTVNDGRVKYCGYFGIVKCLKSLCCDNGYYQDKLYIDLGSIQHHFKEEHLKKINYLKKKE